MVVLSQAALEDIRSHLAWNRQWSRVESEGFIMDKMADCKHRRVELSVPTTPPLLFLLSITIG